MRYIVTAYRKNRNVRVYAGKTYTAILKARSLRKWLEKHNEYGIKIVVTKEGSKEPLITIFSEMKGK